MSRKKKKPISFDAMVKFFMQNYNIPTKKDIDRLSRRIDHIEQLIIKSMDSQKARSAARGKSRSGMTASDTVLEVVRDFDDGVGFAEIKDRTGFGEKKLRNIIYRLNDLGKIERKSRGVYWAPREVPEQTGQDQIG
jgi:hypothetical protein